MRRGADRALYAMHEKLDPWRRRDECGADAARRAIHIAKRAQRGAIRSMDQRRDEEHSGIAVNATLFVEQTITSELRFRRIVGTVISRDDVAIEMIRDELPKRLVTIELMRCVGVSGPEAVQAGVDP